MCIIALGALFFLANIGIFHTRQVLRFWPVVLIVIGVQKMLQPVSRRISGSAYIWLGLGVWLLLAELDLLHIHLGHIWPLILIVVGWRMLWRNARPRLSDDDPAAQSYVNSFAIMGGFERTSSTSDFKGGDLTAFMGGGKVDLSQARIANSPATIDVFVMWGGIELVVPDDWIVTIQVLPIMGGFEDKTHPPADGTQRLVINGVALMGGLGVKSASAVALGR
jgi:predicted membrane protein